MNIVLNLQNILIITKLRRICPIENFPQCSPEASPCGAIFGSILPVNIGNYSSLAKTLNMTPPELVRNPGKSPSADNHPVQIRFLIDLPSISRVVISLPGKDDHYIMTNKNKR